MIENTYQITNEALKRVSLNECEYIHVFGRNNGDLNPLNLYWTSSGVEIKVKASEVWVEVESSYNCHENWMSVTVNGTRISRQMLPKGRYYVPLVRNMSPDNENDIRIFKDVQIMSGDEEHALRIYSFLIDGEFMPIPEKKVRFEFIGDSITSGEGVIGAKQDMDWIGMYFDSVNEYASLTAAAFDADYHIISQSGWGVLTGWDNNPSCALPDYYSKLCGLAFGEKNKKQGADLTYDFSKWSADVIVINLGTNDGGALNSPEYIDPITGKRTKQRLNDDGTIVEEDRMRFVNKCKQFLGELRFYNPDSYIMWVYGMLGYVMEPSIKQAIEEFKAEQNDKKISYVRLVELNDETVGSRFHPGSACHKQAAEILISEIKKVL